MKLPTLPHDKANHAVYGVVIYLATVALMLFLGLFFEINSFITTYAPIVVTVIFGLGKEVYSVITKKGQSEVMDAICTVILPVLILILTNI